MSIRQWLREKLAGHQKGENCGCKLCFMEILQDTNQALEKILEGKARLYVLPDEAAVARFHTPPFDRWPKLFRKVPK